MTAIAVIIAMAFGVAYLKILIEFNKANELERMVNCEHENSEYYDWSPDGKWKCNDCGKLY